MTRCNSVVLLKAEDGDSSIRVSGGETDIHVKAESGEEILKYTLRNS